MELPASFIDYTRALLGDEEYDKLAVAIQQEPPVSIRLNDGKLKIENGKCRIVPQAGCITDFQLSAFNFEFNQVPWSSEGFYLDERLTFTFDPLFHAGCYYVQEASSMFVEQVLRQYVTGPVKMLDLVQLLVESLLMPVVCFLKGVYWWLMKSSGIVRRFLRRI